MVRATSLRNAIQTWILNECSDTELLENGNIRGKNPPWQPIDYTHPLEFIESYEKSLDGLHGFMWEIQRFDERKLDREFWTVLLSKDPQAVEGYINECRPIFRKSFPRVRSHAFVWYLKSGALVTFHRVKQKSVSAPIEILARYLLPWRTDTVVPWDGTLDDILEQMNLG